MYWASGGLVGRVIAVPIFFTTDAEKSVDVLDDPEINEEAGFEVFDPDTGLVVAAQPKKFGIVTFTPAQSWVLNEMASEK